MSIEMNSTKDTKTYVRTSTPLRRCMTLLSGLLLCIVFLSAYSGIVAQSSVQPTPPIDHTLHNEGNTELRTFQQWIALMHQYQGDVTPYQQQYHSDEQALQSATSQAAYQRALQGLKAHITAIKVPALKTESNFLFQELEQEAAQFEKQHTYHDSYNNTTYPLGYEYGPNGATGPLWLQGELAAAKTPANYQQAIDDLNTDLTNFQAMQANFSDKTPSNQVHQTDLQLMQHYGYMESKVRRCFPR